MLRLMAVVLAVAFFAPAALAQGTLKIAVVGPMAFVQGEHHWAGAELARDEINAAGGISVGKKKLKIDLVKIDSNEMQSVPDATNAMERAVTREKADFVIGGFRSEAVLAMQEIAMDNKKLFLGCGAGDAKLGDERGRELRPVQVLVPRHAAQLPGPRADHVRRAERGRRADPRQA